MVPFGACIQTGRLHAMSALEGKLFAFHIHPGYRLRRFINGLGQLLCNGCYLPSRTTAHIGSDDNRSVMHHVMNGEYAGFFDIGMVQRNESQRDHRARHDVPDPPRGARMPSAAGRATPSCEDTDLGLTMLEHGWQTHYTNRRYGYGLLPDTFDAYKKQRHRWAYGGFQIVRKHWRQLLARARSPHPGAEARIRARAGSTGSAPKRSASWWRSST